MILVSGQDHTATGKPGSPWMRLPPISPDCHPSRTRNCASGSTAAGCRRTAACWCARDREASRPCRAPSRLPVRCARSSEHHPLIRRHDRGAHVRHRLRIRGLRRPRRAALRSGVQAGLWSPARERSRSDVAADLVQARERPIMARTGAQGADDDRSVLRQLRARAPTHRARH